MPSVMDWTVHPISIKFVCLSHNPQDLRMWSYFEIGSLQKQWVKMRSYYSQVSCLNQNNWCLIKRRNSHTHRSHHMNMKAKIRILCLQVKKWDPQETIWSQERGLVLIFPQWKAGINLDWQSFLTLLASRTVR